MQEPCKTASHTKAAPLTAYQLAAAALITALTCILGPMSVPIGPIPVSLTNLAALFGVTVLGLRLGAMSQLAYLLLGAAGLPVFSGYAGGLVKLVGPTGGYLVGFFVMTVVAGAFAARFEGRPLPSLAGMALGIALDYVLGTAWFMFQMGCGLGYALLTCVAPFVLWDAAKAVLAYVLGMAVRRRLARAGLLARI